MRVITGTARGRRLKAPKGMDTRPTSDRTKESLFNIVGPEIIGVNFLDLFAGTGAIGIEALSRGAEFAVFVEKNQHAVNIIKDNLELTHLTERARVITRSVDAAVEALARESVVFDIIFLDPPYRRDMVQATLEKLNEKKLLTPGGLIITESSKLDIPPDEVRLLGKIRQEKYGDTVLSFYKEF